jgi:hypothetical protein
LIRLGFSHWIASNIIAAGNLALFALAFALKDLPAFLLGIIMLGSGIFACCIPKIWFKFVLKKVEVPAVHFRVSE